MAKTPTERQREWREKRKRAAQLPKDDARITALEIHTKALEARLRALEDRPLPVPVQAVQGLRDRLAGVAMNPAMQHALADFDKVNKEMGKASMIYVADDDPGDCS